MTDQCPDQSFAQFLFGLFDILVIRQFSFTVINETVTVTDTDFIKIF